MPSSGLDEDVLQVGQRRLPRWAWFAAIAAVAGLVIAAIVTHPSSGEPATASTSSQLGNPPAAVPGGALDVAVSGHEVWVLRPGRITLSDDHTSARATGRFSADVSDPDNPPQMLVDAAHGLLWVVAWSGDAAKVIEFNAFTLQHLRTLDADEIGDAAALDGRLYLTSRRSLIEIGPDADRRTVANSPSTTLFFQVAADSAGRRLLVDDAGFPTHLWAYRPDDGLRPVSRPMAFAKATVAVAAGRVWVGGFGNHGAVLEQSDAGRRSPLARDLGPGAVIVAAGSRVFWVRSGNAELGDLWCVDARTGRALQHWVVSGAIASTTGAAVAATPSGVQWLHLRGCPG